MKNNKKYNAVTSLLLIVALFICIGNTQAQYREFIDLHFGNKQYISGESIHYKAYCFSQKGNKSEFLSKVLYVELLNKNYIPIIQQVLHIDNNRAASEIQIPDTVQTGVYILKAYTNWMKNFNPEEHFTEVIYIYNQHNHNGIKTINFPVIPQVYIQGGYLMANIKSKMIVKIPTITGVGIKGKVITKNNSNEILSFKTNSDGVANFEFTPKKQVRYSLKLVDENDNSTYYDLPAVSDEGIQLSNINYQNKSLDLTLHNTYPGNGLYRLILINNKNMLYETSIKSKMGEQPVNIDIDLDAYTELQLKIYDENGSELTSEFIIFHPNWNQQKVVNTMAKTGDRIALRLNLHNVPVYKKTGVSVSISKVPDYERENMALSSPVITSGYAMSSVNSDVSVVYPRIFSDKNQSVARKDISNNEFMIEDFGMLLKGHIFNKNKLPIANATVILSVLDSIGLMLRADTDSGGNFTILLNEHTDKMCRFQVRIGNKQYPDDYIIEIEDNFYYSSNGITDVQRLSQTKNIDFTNYLNNESKRTLIQRVFTNDENDNEHAAILQESSEPFYGQPNFTVYPKEFIELENFDELIKEIVPSVRYKYSKKGTTISVYDINNNSRSDNPVVLLDGIPVDNLAELYPLSTTEIQRIDVQTELRATGNFLYKGLVAIYTTPEYRNKIATKKLGEHMIRGYSNTQARIINTTSVLEKSNKIPDFRNELYWAPDLNIDSLSLGDVYFLTSDEEGNYKVVIQAYSVNGLPINIQSSVQIAAEN